MKYTDHGSIKLSHITSKKQINSAEVLYSGRLNIHRGNQEAMQDHNKLEQGRKN